ncbi:MAG: type II toxin-antitoxin system RelE/ParE family toxin [Alphaproteobacteria bacterium]|nr:type II toxin-antitoxin system RelE/ParE family toxin [Alphaproteobacteria bacterium]
MQIRWLEEAVIDLQKLHTYIQRDNSQAANNIAKRLYEAVEVLGQYPGMGRPGRVPYTRELILSGSPYIIPYRVKDERIEILRVLHTSMSWSEVL